MNGTHILLMLTHLFRKQGKRIPIEDAVYTLSFKWRYGTPTSIRKILTLAQESDMISVSEGYMQAEFLFDSQTLEPNQADILRRQTIIREDVKPLR